MVQVAMRLLFQILLCNYSSFWSLHWHRVFTAWPLGTFNNTVIFVRKNTNCGRVFLLGVLGKMNLMENIILGWWMSGEIPHSMTIYFILGFFIKSSVTSDYNEPSVSVTHVFRMISYLRSLCVLWPPWLWGAGEVAQCVMPLRVWCSLYINIGGIILICIYIIL